ncbi:hypothetical protein ACFFSW_21060 [Saccharothrix longispora]|uniref:Uncharacterized protein n=1 Tax=Saccharothrix longispora TaxID=33920 RepID=A0ABU1Q613_9PSEU|nr:hypothetical protein [Saccharothrix longispora]MDR6598330.1 hypothetical protein [Saccharothrix longispora]
MLIGVVRFTWAAAVVCAGLAVISAISAASTASVCFTSDLGTHVLTSVERGRAHLGAQSLRICIDDPTTGERVLAAVERGARRGPSRQEGVGVNTNSAASTTGRNPMRW